MVTDKTRSMGDKEYPQQYQDSVMDEKDWVLGEIIPESTVTGRVSHYRHPHLWTDEDDFVQLVGKTANEDEVGIPT